MKFVVAICMCIIFSTTCAVAADDASSKKKQAKGGDSLSQSCEAQNKVREKQCQELKKLYETAKKKQESKKDSKLTEHEKSLINPEVFKKTGLGTPVDALKHSTDLGCTLDKKKSEGVSPVYSCEKTKKKEDLKYGRNAQLIKKDGKVIASEFCEFNKEKNGYTGRVEDSFVQKPYTYVQVAEKKGSYNVVNKGFCMDEARIYANTSKKCATTCKNGVALWNPSFGELAKDGPVKECGKSNVPNFGRVSVICREDMKLGQDEFAKVKPEEKEKIEKSVREKLSQIKKDDFDSRIRPTRVEEITESDGGSKKKNEEVLKVGATKKEDGKEYRLVSIDDETGARKWEEINEPKKGTTAVAPAIATSLDVKEDSPIISKARAVVTDLNQLSESLSKEVSGDTATVQEFINHTKGRTINSVFETASLPLSIGDHIPSRYGCSTSRSECDFFYVDPSQSARSTTREVRIRVRLAPRPVYILVQ